MKLYLSLLLFLTACSSHDDEVYYEGKKATFEILNRDVNELLIESNAKWDSLSKITPPPRNVMFLNGRLDALAQLSYRLRDSLSKYANVTSR